MLLSKKNNRKSYLISRLEYFYKNFPKKLAIVSKEHKFTYKQFYESAYNLAKNLDPRSRIAIIDDNKPLSYIAICASLIAGCTYIPITSTQPIKRINKIIQLSNASFIFCENQKKFKRKNSNKIFLSINNLNEYSSSKINLKSNNKIFNNLAYIIFTSGSTGEPKGVKISRSNLDHYIKWITKYFNAKIGDNFTQVSPLGFDLSVAEMFSSLCSGGTLFPIENLYDKLFLGKFIKINKINFLTCVPSSIEVMYNGNSLNHGNLKTLKHIFFCGETLLKSQLKKLFDCKLKSKITNTYGPTETTVSCTFINITKKNFLKITENETSIGKPIKNMKILLIKKGKINQRDGEIFIKGPQVGMGYINSKSQKSFDHKKNTYRTGDLGKIINGNLYFNGRIDNQIKINGFRVELLEIEKCTKKNFKINDCKAIFSKNKINLYIQNPNKININKIKNKFNEILPSYMIPSNIYFLKELPINENGKIDLRKLNYI